MDYAILMVLLKVQKKKKKVYIIDMKQTREEAGNQLLIVKGMKYSKS